MRSVALLRGINVGGHNMVKMPILTSIVESIGAIDVSTYLQSGNVLLDSPMVAPVLDRTLEAAFAEALGFDVPVVTRSRAAMAGIARSHPFATSSGDERSLHVVFLSEQPSEEAVGSLAVPEGCADRLILDGAEVYLDLENAGRTKLTLAWLERQLGVRGTQRNWRTTRTVAELLSR